LTAYPDGDDLGRLTRRGATWLMMVGRLKPGATIAQARANLDTIAQALVRDYPDANPRTWGIAVAASGAVPAVVRAGVTGFVAVLFVLVGLVLLIACTNVGGMLLARGVGRTRDVAVRLALGAPGGRIVRLLIAESLVLAAGGALAGVVG